MKLNALLMCREQDSLRMLVGALDELDIDGEVCVSGAEALELLALGCDSAFVVDFDLPGASPVARTARLTPRQRCPVVFALRGELTDVATAFQAGANFVLYKPLEPHQMLGSLRADGAFMQADRRRGPRKKTEALVYLRFGDVCPVPALLLDGSEDGLSVQATEPLPAAELPMRFSARGRPYDRRHW